MIDNILKAQVIFLIYDVTRTDTYERLENF